MRVPIETVCKELPDLRPTEFSGRQTNAMNEDELGFHAGRPVILVRRWTLRPRAKQPSSGTDGVIQGLCFTQLAISVFADALTWSFLSVLNVNAAVASVVKHLLKREVMSTPRLFSPIQLRASTGLFLGSEQARYVGRVLRLRPGDELTVFDGTGGEYPATVGTVTKRELKLSVGEYVSRNSESTLRIRLLQGVSRGEKMDIVVQKATELGVHRISPVLTEFSVVKLDADRAAKRRDHWQKVAQSACEQCNRNFVPIVDAPQTLLDWFGDNSGSDDVQLILRPDAVESMPAVDMPGSALTILVGPEGGFSQAELERATAAGLQAVRLGPRVMRTETAALAALSIAQATWGDYRAP